MAAAATISTGPVYCKRRDTAAAHKVLLKNSFKKLNVDRPKKLMVQTRKIEANEAREAPEL
jgi:hypothetical protein